MRNEWGILVAKPQGIGSRRKLRLRDEDNIKTDPIGIGYEGMGWIQDTAQWQV
jgi:hypothetical protein